MSRRARVTVPVVVAVYATEKWVQAFWTVTSVPRPAPFTSKRTRPSLTPGFSEFVPTPFTLHEAAHVGPQFQLRPLLPLSKSAIATNVILTFIWSWNAFLWPLIVTRTPDMQTLPLGLARFLTMMEDTTGALYAFVVLVLVPGLAIFLMAQKEFIRGLTSGATKG